MAVGTTRGKRRLGRYVKPIRLRSKLSAEDVAERASCSAHTVYRLESGEALPSRTRVAAILAVIGATDEERQRAFELREVADLGTKPIQHFEELPVKYRRFRLDETEAVIERTLDMVIIPGLLQTEDYAHAISVAARRLIKSDNWDEFAGPERRERQALLTRDHSPLSYHGLIAEGALRNIIGGPSVLAGQLDHLLKLIELSQVTIQVIPFGFGACGITSGPLFLFGFADEDEQDAAYVESALGMEAVQDSADAAALAAVWDDVASAAPSPEQSAEMIRAERKRVKKR
ncbi:MAG TPA: helix-turn-helix transcriptional regulator [Pseudonocardiaceae bacterium]|jgi:transcriptional regulator with XRE-family HTH domain|nr:helix-turn-helix transcriptional regulator [Pseudonocardiaceae bacterium]